MNGSKGVTIRAAEAADAMSIAELSDALGYPISTEAARARLEGLLARPDQMVLVAELSSSGVIGWIHAAEQELIESGLHCEILGLIIGAGQRGQGIGRELVARVEEWARRRGLRQISVRSNIMRAESHPFYLRLGFGRVKTQHAYRKEIK